MRAPNTERWWVKRARKRRERGAIEPDRFFGGDYPKAIASNLRLYRALSGSIAIAVRGVGEWTLNLGNVEEPVSPVFDRSAEARLCFVPSAFVEFLRGTLDVQAAIATGFVIVGGDATLIAKLGQILQPARSILQARAEISADR